MKRNPLIFEVDEQTGKKKKRKQVRFLTQAANMSLSPQKLLVVVFISCITFQHVQKMRLVFLCNHAAVYFTLRSTRRYQR